MSPVNDFIQALPTHHEFTEAFNTDLYTPLPDHWLLIATDVKGSTRAIEAGRYKEVNTLGATTIISVINASRPHQICFQFGGDGALLAIPPDCLDRVQQALSQLIQLSKVQFDLELRVAIWSLQEFKERNLDIRLLKYAVAPDQFVFMFSGSGVEASDTWLKDNSGGTNLFQLGHAPLDARYTEGLECRWNPVENQNGLMCTGLVKPTRSDQANTILREIHEVLDVGRYPDTIPTHLKALPVKWPPKDLLVEWRMRTAGQSGLSRLSYLIKALAKTLFLTPLVAIFKDKIPYLQEIGQRSDYQKFDGMFRFVRDLSPMQFNQLQTLCEKLHQEGKIYYGLHQSSSALMTCMVFTGEDHFHFVDGSQGGYALAAKQLKEQMKRPRLDSKPETAI